MAEQALDLAVIHRTRAGDPEAIAARAAARARPEPLSADRRLFIIAADHPARGALGVGDDETAMEDRHELLRRLLIALAVPGVDGVLATPDVLDDLLLLGALEGKVVVGSMNRGGLAGAVFEMDDRFTGATIDSIRARRFDFAKLLLRINFEDPDSVRTLEASAAAVAAAAAQQVPLMIEPFISRWVDGRVVNDLSPAAVARSVAIASGLGPSSDYTWLKLPVVPEMERVMRSTTLPTLLLGGDPGAERSGLYDRWRAAIAIEGVRGLVVGRTLLYPPGGDVAEAVAEAAAIVHS